MGFPDRIERTMPIAHPPEPADLFFDLDQLASGICPGRTTSAKKPHQERGRGLHAGPLSSWNTAEYKLDI